MKTQSIEKENKNGSATQRHQTGQNASGPKAKQGQENKVQEHFDRVAGRYASWYNGETSNAHSFSVRLRRVLEMLPPKVGTLLDLGCGPGLLFEGVRDDQAGGPPRLIGMDFAGQMLVEADARVNNRGHRAYFLRGEASRLPFTNQSVNTLTCMGLMEYLDDEDLTLQEISRVLSPGGTAIITLPNIRCPYRIWHRFMHGVFAGLKGKLPNNRYVLTAEAILGPFGQDVVAHREYSESDYKQRLRKFGLEAEDVCYYNFKISLTPLDKWLPRLSLQTSRRLESLARGPMRFLATAFIVKARKSA